jgi:hypothetical protein
MTIDEFRKLLNENLVSFTFLKKDGSFRKMIGTTNPAVTGLKVDPANTPTTAVSSDRINVYDVELGEWRVCFFSKLDPYTIPKAIA